MQKVIVTTSGFTGYSTIFKVDGDSIDLHGVEETDPVEYENLCLATLPFDVKVISYTHCVRLRLTTFARNHSR